MLEHETNLADLDKEKEVFTQEEIRTFALNPGYPARDRALFVALYLSNSRVSEIVRRVRKYQIKLDHLDGREYLVFNGLWTEKHPKHPRRVIVAPTDKEGDLAEVLLTYITKFDDNSVIFPISRQYAWKILKRMSGQRCHYLRHTRITHLLLDYKLPIHVVQEMAGWKTLTMIEEYKHLDWASIARMM